MADNTWLKCSACRRDLPFGAVHWVCSVSTCNRNRMRLVFCTVACWDSHLSTVRHREAWAVEARAPSQVEWAREQEAERAADAAAGRPAPVTAPATGAPVVRRMVEPPRPIAPVIAGGLALADAERDMLIVVSKLKKYIKDRSGMNTSDSVAELLSDHVRAICDDAIRTAATDERKTVLDRDVPKVPRRG
jgi:hypothetical protein